MMSACACMGPQGADPYCPCEMRQRGLASSAGWTEEEKAKLTEALGKMFGWTEIKREVQKDE